MSNILKAVFCGLLLAQIAQAKPMENDVEFCYPAQYVITDPMGEIQKLQQLTIEGMKPEDDAPALLQKLKTLPKLKNLDFDRCDLTKIHANDPVPPGVETLVIGGGHITQDTIDWLSKFPAGTVLLIGGIDLRGLKLHFGHFRGLHFEECKLSRSVVIPLVQKTFEVTFKEVTLIDDK